jgi:Domain of unknown function (DUF397)
MDARNEPVYPARAWVRADRCGPNGGNCVELNYEHPTLVGVRDSKSTELLNFHRNAWTAFLVRM